MTDDDPTVATPAHVFAELLATGRLGDLELPEKIATWVELTLRKRGWSHPSVIGRWGETAGSTRIEITLPVVQGEGLQMARVPLGIRVVDDLIEDQIVDLIRQQLEASGRMPILVPSPGARS